MNRDKPAAAVPPDGGQFLLISNFGSNLDSILNVIGKDANAVSIYLVEIL